MRWPYDPQTSVAFQNNPGKSKKGRKSMQVWSPKKLGPKPESKAEQEPSSSQSSTPLKRTVSTDSDGKEKVEFGEGELISVREALPLLESQDDCMDISEIPISEMETQVLEVEGSTETMKSESAYYCELCLPRKVDPEVPMGGRNDTPDKTHYLTLQREDGLLLRKNDTVYVLRDWPPEQSTNPDGTPKQRKTYETAGPLVPSECDIFRIDSLWKDTE
jgi:hypothetical protein